MSLLYTIAVKQKQKPTKIKFQAKQVTFSSSFTFQFYFSSLELFFLISWGGELGQALGRLEMRANVNE